MPETVVNNIIKEQQGGEAQSEVFPLITVDSSDDMAEAVANHLVDSSLREGDRLVDVSFYNAMNLVNKGYVFYVIDPREKDKIVSSVSVRPTDTQDVIRFLLDKDNANGDTNGDTNGSFCVIELSTGRTDPDYRKKGIMSGILSHFRNYKDVYRMINKGEKRIPPGLVFGTIQPENEEIISALKRAKFEIVHQRKVVCSDDGVVKDEFGEIKDDDLFQDDYPFASYFLHMWPGNQAFGIHNLKGEKPMFVEGGTRDRSLAISDKAGFKEIDKILRNKFDPDKTGDLTALVNAIATVRNSAIKAAPPNIQNHLDP